MGKKRKRQRPNENLLAAVWRSDIGKRLIALAGLAAIVGAVVVLLAAGGLLGGQGGGTTESGREIENALVTEPPAPPGLADFDVGASVGDVAPDFELSDFEGERLKLSDFRGQPVYVNFWATWCTPCIIEMPDMQELLARHPELAIIAVNRAEPLGRARDFLAGLERHDGSEGLSFTVNGLDPDDTLYNEFRGLGMPVSIFVDAAGVITFVQNGLLRLSDMEAAFALTLDSAPTQMGDSAPQGGS
ncbi:MAG: TlpA family protein disulfide reductase [Dehalococcoidia bacterium]